MRITRRWLSVAVLYGVMITLATGGARAANAALDALDREIFMKAREQPVRGFMTELFAQIGVPVVIDEEISGSVNGDFRKSARAILDDVRKVFQIGFYYDGAKAYVYPIDEIEREVLYVEPAIGSRVVDNAAMLGLPDERNELTQSDMGLVVTGNARFIEQVRELSDAMENQARHAAAPESFRIFKLQYGWADDKSFVIGGQTLQVPGVASLLRQLVATDSLDTGSAVTLRERLPATRPGLRGRGLQSIGGGSLADESDDASGSQSIMTSSITAPNDPGTGSGPTIIADALNNAVIIRDRADRMPDYKRIIDTLDIEPKTVEIEATIIDMDTDRLRELGIDWRLRSDSEDAVFGADDGDANFEHEVAAGGEGGVVSLVLDSRRRFLARIRALEEQGAARIVSKPHVITLANVEALLDSTSTFFVRVEGDEEVDLFDVSVGTTLRVTPHVYESAGRAEIKMLVNIEDGSTSDERVDEIPVIERSTINTQALIEEGESLLIGGLVREINRNRVSKVPLLGDIPGLGALFRSHAKASTQTERMFLITPRVALRDESGKRLDAPILEGSEAAIVRSAPFRLERTRAALEARDTAFPVKPTLPRGMADVDLRSDTVRPKAYVLDRRSAGSNELEDSPGAAPEPNRPEAADLVRTGGAAGIERDRWQAVPGWRGP